MKRMNRTIIFIIVVLLLALLLPVLAGPGLIGLPDDSEQLDDDDFSAMIPFPIMWINVQFHQVTLLLKQGMSIFALYVVYLGGRSKHRRFNDRTLDIINSLNVVFSKTALFIGAVFNFLLRGFSLVQIKNSAMKSVLPSKVSGFPIQGGIYP